MSDPLLQSFLAERDAPCPGCGYNLRGLTVDTCPECRAEIRLGIDGKQPNKGHARYVGLVLLLNAVQFGLSGGFYIWMILGSTIQYTSSWRIVIHSALYLVLSVASLIACVRLMVGWRTPGRRSEHLTFAMLIAVTTLGAFSLWSLVSIGLAWSSW